MFRTSTVRRSFSCITYRSKLFAPTKKDTSLGKIEMARYGRLLLKGGYVHQTEPGMYSYLPIGQRVIDEMMKVVNFHLDTAGAQKMQMPILQNMNRLEKTDRKNRMGRELYSLKDRKDQVYCLSPTNEEVVTDIIKDLSILSNYPMTLYQISPKFRDEMRIVSGILRSKEFLMMDAYSFDTTLTNAEKTYQSMDTCFQNIFKDLEIPIATLEADNGIMGGQQSREYQCCCGVGQDKVVKCSHCDYLSLLDSAQSFSKNIPYFDSDAFQRIQAELDVTTTKEDFRSILRDHKEITDLISVFDVRVGDKQKQILIPSMREININSVCKKLNIHDECISKSTEFNHQCDWVVDHSLSELFPFFLASLYNVSIGDFTLATHDDYCKKCDQRDSRGYRVPNIEVNTSLELGHSFLLGDRYSTTLGLKTTSGPVQMGCYGLGISRLLGCIFQLYGYKSGILLPDTITTYDVVLVNASKSEKTKKCVMELLDALSDTNSLRILFDDRDDLSVGTQLKDAELCGVRLALVVGKQFESKGVIDICLLHKALIQDVLMERTSEDVGEIHEALKQKIGKFDLDRLEQLGYNLKQKKEMKDKGNEGYLIQCGFNDLYWNMIQTLSCIKVYSSKS